jgi:hypothetical protein
VRDVRQSPGRQQAGDIQAGDAPAGTPPGAARPAAPAWASAARWDRWDVVRAEHRSLDRRRLIPWLVVFAVYAAGLALVSGGGADRVWALWATGGYALAAALAWLTRGVAAPLLTALACAVVAPIVWLILRGPATADPIVVARSAVLLLRHGNPYLSTGQLATWQSYNPYLPAMTVFGLPWAAGLRGVLGDTRLWLTAASLALLGAAFWMGAPHRAARCGACRRAAAWSAVFGVATPLLALPLAVGITDPPVIALTCLALACLARSPRLPVVAGLAVGVACAMKATAWPALAVIAAMLVARDGARVAARFAAVSVVTTAGLVAVTVPALLATPGALFQNTVLFPLGLTSHQTPAASPLPGHLLASTGRAGHLAAVALLVVAALAVAASLVVRPPADVPAATRRLALGLALLFLLAPATRFGYFAYPAALLGWSAMTGRDRSSAASAAANPARAPVSP